MGQYVPVASAIHALDPRAKLLALLVLMGVVFVSTSPWALACCLLLLGACIRGAGLSWRLVLSSSRPILYLALFTFVFNVVAHFFWGEALLSDALAEGTFFSLRLTILMLFALLLPLTTAPLELSDGLEALLLPFARWGVPAHECAMMIGIALRFIPLLMEEMDRIVKAQLSRGARLDQGGLLRRVMAFFPILIPLFVIIFRRADELALAMEARGYRGGKGRTRRRPLQWKKNDTRATILVMSVAVLFLSLRRWLRL